MTRNYFGLLRIELRRNIALWFVPVILLVSWWLLSAWGWIAILWSSTNEQLQASVVPFAAPAMVGAAAWMAGRERRRGTADLLVSTPSSTVGRGITLWVATALWGIVAYAVFAAYMMGRTALSATWGGPELWRVVIVLTAILAFAVWGFFFGNLVPSRFTAPLAALAALGLQLFLTNYKVSHGSGGYSQTWITYLSPDKTTYDLAPWQALIYVGLTAAGLAALGLKNRRDIARWVALAASAGLAIAGVVMVWGEWPRYDPLTGAIYNGWGQRIETDVKYVAPEPVCAGSPVAVCVHPQYQPLLDEVVAPANHLAEPLLGLPGVPLRAEQEDVPFSGGGTTSPLKVGDRASLDVSYFADKLVADPGSLRDGMIRNEAQLAIRSWLLEQAALGSLRGCPNLMPEIPDEMQRMMGLPSERACEAMARFAELTPDQQRTWFEQHYSALRAGELSLEDLP